jgi:hypothetical protein
MPQMRFQAPRAPVLCVFNDHDLLGEIHSQFVCAFGRRLTNLKRAGCPPTLNPQSVARTPIDVDRVWRLFADAGHKEAECESQIEGEEAMTGMPKLAAKIAQL